ncbi:Protease 2 [Linum perenne]
MAITRSCILASRVSTSSYLRRFLTAAFSTAPPAAKKVPAAVTAHGRTWQDPYQWMRNTSDPEFIDYIRRENSYAAEFMADTSQLQRVLVREMKSRLPAKVSTPPERWGNWLYYQYVPEGKEYPVLCRRLEENDDSGMVKKLFSFVTGEFRKEQTLLDWNEIAEQYGYVHVGTCRVSPSHDFIAYTVDVNGSEQFLLRIKDLSNGTIVDRLEVEGVVSLAWAQDGRTLFYTVSDNNQRPYRVMCTEVGSDGTSDITVYTEKDSSFCVDITSTKDGKFITVYVIDAARPLDGLERICNRVSDVQCFVEHHYGSFFILTNAPLSENKEIADGSYYLVTCRTDHVHSNDLQQIILPSEDVSFHDMDVFHRHLVLSVTKEGLPRMCSINLPIQDSHFPQKQFDIEELNPWYFPVPTDLCSIVPGSNHEFSSTMYRVVLSSPVMPDAIVDYDMSKRTSSIVHQDEVRDRHYREHETDEVERWKDLSLERKQVVSHDGVEIPLTILLSRKAWRKGQSPGLLHGYGAYGETLDTSWSSERLSLLDRGWVIAFADVRGGGGNDSSWHKSGTMLAKPNSIHDFMSCASFLVDEGYVHSKKLAAQGTSAGGLLVAASINMKTDLFRAAILKVPFLDICNSLLDPSLPLTILDYEEFGNPQIESQFDCIRNYSPYDNIQHGKCPPAMLVTSSYNDSRVGVWEAAKWVARLRDVTCPSCSRSVVLKTSMNSGHFGEGGYYSQCEETAYEYAFLMEAVGEVNTVMN